MSRLTKKINNTDYMPKIEKVSFAQLIDKLGQLEDLMEDLNIDSVEELRKYIEDLGSYVGAYVNDPPEKTQQIVKDLNTVARFRKELGCPLEIVFKALKQNISFQRKEIITNKVHILEGFDSYIVYNKGRKRYELHTTFKVGRSYSVADLDLKYYGKTWLLKGERNEK